MKKKTVFEESASFLFLSLFLEGKKRNETKVAERGNINGGTVTLRPITFHCLPVWIANGDILAYTHAVEPG